MDPVLGRLHRGQRDVTDLTALEANTVTLAQHLPAARTGRRNKVLSDIGLLGPVLV